MFTPLHTFPPLEVAIATPKFATLWQWGIGYIHRLTVARIPAEESHMAVWVVRGGRRREQEEEALASGVLAIGYALSEDLSDTRTIEGVKSLLRQKDPNAADGSIGSDASRLWNFKENIKIGDLVVMPRKGQSTISIGEMTGEYQFRSDVPDMSHAREVTWINRELLRDSLEPDLQKSMNASGTVYKPRSNNGEKRLRAAAETGRNQEPDNRSDDDTSNGIPKDFWSPENVGTLAEEILWEADYLQKIVDGLKDKRQAIFQGPPGTGKTYVAKRIAEWCRKHGGDFQIVQFHPSYSYEDFVEGFRPTLTEGGQAGFTLTRGPLRRLAEKAEENPEATFVLVIDEINRGNLAKVLGELYFLLEYRNQEVALQYSGEGFSLPGNLWFIGTMNTTDRSIALVDAALRRRFYFFGFFPDDPPIRGLLNLWLEMNNPEARWVAGLVDLANRKLEDRHLGIGPSYFMKKDPPLDENRVRFIWEQAVIPYIEDQCFGDEDKLKEFAYDRLKRELGSVAHEPVGGGDHPGVITSDEDERSEGGAGDASP